MAKITFLHDQITIEAPSGTTLQAAVEMANATLPFGCRKGSCGTCRCLITEGISNVNPLTTSENELFESLTSIHPNERLACQVVILGDVKIQS